MVPSKFPKMTAAKLHIGEEYQEGKKFTAVGWLKHMYLLDFNSDEIKITAADHKHFADACKKFREVNKISRYTTLHDWEDTTTKVKQVAALNKFFAEEKKCLKK